MSDESIRHVFLSHTSVDKPFVRKLSIELQKQGITSWIDEAEIHYGDSLIYKITDAIEHISLVVVIISKNSIDSNWVRHELDWAMTKEIRNRKINVIPVLIDKCDIPFFLLNKLYADFTDDRRFYENTIRLANSIKYHMGIKVEVPIKELPGDNVPVKYKPLLFPIFYASTMILFSLILIFLPSITMIYPGDIVKNDLIMKYVRGIGFLFLMTSSIELIRISLARYMMRINANYSRDSIEMRTAFLWQKRYWKHISKYWKFTWMKVLVLVEWINLLITLFLAFNVVQFAIQIIKKA